MDTLSMPIGHIRAGERLMAEKKREAERLTAEELAEAGRWLRRAWFTGGKHFHVELRTDLLGKLLAAAEENAKLRAAIESHKFSCNVCSEPIGILHDRINATLWEAAT